MKLFVVLCTHVSFSQLIGRRVNIDKNEFSTEMESHVETKEEPFFHIVGRSEYQPDLCFNIPQNLRNSQVLLINDPNLGFNATGVVKNDLTSLKLHRYAYILSLIIYHDILVHMVISWKWTVTVGP